SPFAPSTAQVRRTTHESRASQEAPREEWRRVAVLQSRRSGSQLLLDPDPRKSQASRGSLFVDLQDKVYRPHRTEPMRRTPQKRAHVEPIGDALQSEREVARRGIEPLFPASEAGVLPIDDRASVSNREDRVSLPGERSPGAS